MTFIEKFIIVKIGIIITLIAGWIINIFQIVNDFTTIGNADIEMILRLIGIIVAPLGSVMGLFVW